MRRLSITVFYILVSRGQSKRVKPQDINENGLFVVISALNSLLLKNTLQFHNVAYKLK